MKPFDWDYQKNQKLKEERAVSFEDILGAIYDNKVLDTVSHHNQAKYAHQTIIIVRIEDYAYLVPCVEDDDKIFLKTIIPSRKATRKYLKGEDI